VKRGTVLVPKVVSLGNVMMSVYLVSDFSNLDIHEIVVKIH